MDAAWIFFLIAFVGLSYLLIAVMLGGEGKDTDGGDADADADAEVDADADADMDADADADGELSDHDAHDLAHDLLHGDAHHHDHGHSRDDGQTGAGGSGIGSFLLGWLSGKVIAALLIGFGTMAGMLTIAGMPLWLCIAAGLPTGWFFGFCVKTLTRLVLRGQASSAVREGSLLYRGGTVTQAILEGRVGEVAVGGTVRSARSADGSCIRTGEAIRVLSIDDDVLIVKRDEYPGAEPVSGASPDALELLRPPPDRGKEDRPGIRLTDS